MTCVWVYVVVGKTTWWMGLRYGRIDRSVVEGFMIWDRTPQLLMSLGHMRIYMTGTRAARSSWL